MSLFVSGRRDDAVLVTAENKYHSASDEQSELKSFFDKHRAQVQAPKNQLNLQSKPKGARYWTGRTIVDADHDYLNDLQAFDFYIDDESQVEDLDQLVEHGTNSKKTCNFLSSSARYLAGPDDMLVLKIAFMVYLKFEEYPLALQIALYLDNREVYVAL